MIIVNEENGKLILKHIEELSYGPGDGLYWITTMGNIVYWTNEINEQLCLNIEDFIKVDENVYVYKDNYLKYQRKVKLDKLEN